MAAASPYTSILLVGITGSGKSATGNSILGRDAFYSKTSQVSVTKRAQFEFGEIDDRKIKVVDSPGLCDTELSKQEGAKLVTSAMTESIASSPNGFHAILLIVQYGQRMTNDHVKTVDMLKDIFGHDFIRYHAILVFTNGDIFRIKEKNVNFKDWCDSQPNILRKLIDECNGRTILFDNETTNIDIKMEQTRNLLKMIDKLSGNGALYTNKLFDMAKKTRDSLLKKRQRPQLSDESLMECSLITQQVGQIEYMNTDQAVIQLQLLQIRAEALKQAIMEQDGGTKALTVAIDLVERVMHCINQKKEAVNMQLQLTQGLHKEFGEGVNLSLHTGLGTTGDGALVCGEGAVHRTHHSHDQQQKERKREKEEEEKKRKEEEDKRKKEDEEKITKEEKEKREKEEEKRKKEEEEKRKEMNEKRRQKEEQRMIEEMERKKREILEDVQKMKECYDAVRQEQSWTFGGVVSSLAGPVTGLVRNLFGW